MQSQYAQDMKQILAALQEPGEEDEQKQPLPDEEPVNTVYIYPTDQGGLLFTPTRLEGDEDQEPQTIIDSEKPAPTPRREPPHFLYFLLILLLFVFLDSADVALTALMTPTVNVTIQPSVRNITLQSTAMLGKFLSPITLSETLSVPTTGHGHQKAKQATGTLTFYNGLSTVQSIPAGTVFTGSDGIQVVTDEAVTIAANNPPNDGVVQVLAHAINPGSSGNIPALDINSTFSTALYVKNLTSFINGQDERDYKVVTKADRDSAAETLKVKVASSMNAALQEQLTSAEQLQTIPCTPTISSNHAIGDEAIQIQVTVSETCTAIAYDMQQFDRIALQQLSTQAAKTLGKGYMLFGNMHVTITKATTYEQSSTALLSFTCQGTWVYTLNTQEQERLKSLIEGKPRLNALHLLTALPGIQEVSITGIQDNQTLPDDATHIHLLLIIPIP